MSTILRWLLTALLSALAGAAAHFFEGSCPLDGGSWVCGHWDLVVTIAAFVLAAFGVQVKRPKLAASKAARKVEGAAKIEPGPAPAIEVISDDGRPPGLPPAVLTDSQGTPVTGMSPDDPEWDAVHGGGG